MICSINYRWRYLIMFKLVIQFNFVVCFLFLIIACSNMLTMVRNIMINTTTTKMVMVRGKWKYVLLLTRIIWHAKRKYTMCWRAHYPYACSHLYRCSAHIFDGLRYVSGKTFFSMPCKHLLLLFVNVKKWWPFIIQIRSIQYTGKRPGRDSFFSPWHQMSIE